MRNRLLLGAVVCGLSLCAAGESVAATWSAPTVVRPDVSASGYSVALNAGGEAVAAWSDDSGVYTAIAPRGRAFGRVQQLSTTDNLNPGPLLVEDRRGDAVAYWIAQTNPDATQGVLFASYRRAGRRFGRAVQVASHVELASAGLDGRGNATLVWLGRRRGVASIDVQTRQSNGHVQANSRLAGGTQISTPTVAVNGLGDAIVVWQAGPIQTAVIRYATRIRGKRFGAAQRLRAAGAGVASPDVGLDDTGHALVAFDGGFSTAIGGFPYHEVDAATVDLFAHARWSGPSRGPSTRRVFQAPTTGTDALWGVAPQVEVNGRGDALIVWEISRLTGDPSAIEVDRAPAGHAFGTPRIIATGNLGDVPGSAIGPKGTAIVGWDDELGTTPDLAAVALGPNAGWGAGQAISPATDQAATPAVATNARGDVVALWQDLGPSSQSGSDVPPTPLLFAAAFAG